MTVAPRTSIVKRRMDEYLWWDDHPANRRLRVVLEHHFQMFENVAIVGGMVRDLARVGKAGFNSDVDLVVNAPAGVVADMAKAAGARVNAFGGYSIEKQGWSIDFWALETTWAIREGHVHGDHLEDFTRSTFFNFDAIMYDVRRRRVICDDHYLANLHSREMEINLRPNPTIVGNLFRAIRRVLLWDLSAGPQLKSFITDNLDDKAFADIIRVDNRKSTTPFLYKYKGASELRNAVVSRDYRREMATYYGEQLSLPGLDGASTAVKASTHGPTESVLEAGRHLPQELHRSSLIGRRRNSGGGSRVLHPLF